VFHLEAVGITDPAAIDSIARLEKGFLVNARSLERDMCRLVSRAALSCILRESARTASLVEMGFRADLPTHPLFDRLAGLAGFLAVWYSLVMVAAHPVGWAPWEMLLLGVGIAALACISIAVALWIKTFRFAQRARARRPIAGYLVAAVVAMGASFVLMWSAHLTFTRSLAVGTELQLITWPWSLVGGMIAFVASLLADDRGDDVLVPRRWLQVAEAGFFAVATMVTVHAVTVLLERKCEVVTEVMTALLRFTFPGDCSTTFIPKPLPLQVSAAVAGGVIGWCVPGWIRETMSGPLPGRSATGDSPAPGTS
jgi:hypothetical protein